MSTRSPHSLRQQSGVTLVGMAVTLAVAGTLLSQALPAMGELKERQQLRAVAEQLRADLQETRQRVLLERRNLSVHVGAACYFVHDGSGQDCRCDAARQEVVCTAPTQVLKLQWTPVSLSSNPKRDIVFEAAQGTPGMARLSLRSAHGFELRNIVAFSGRVRTCAVGGGFGGMPACEAAG